MPGSNYSANLKIELMSLGDQTGSWGTTTNSNLGTTLDEWHEIEALEDGTVFINVFSETKR